MTAFSDQIGIKQEINNRKIIGTALKTWKLNIEIGTYGSKRKYQRK